MQLFTYFAAKSFRPTDFESEHGASIRRRGDGRAVGIWSAVPREHTSAHKTIQERKAAEAIQSN